MKRVKKKKTKQHCLLLLFGNYKYSEVVEFSQEDEWLVRLKWGVGE